MESQNFKVVSLGRYLPSRCLESQEVDEILGVANGSVFERTRIKTRYWADENESTIFMAKKAADEALASAGMGMEDIDCVINAGALIPQLIPCTASLLLSEYDVSGKDCFDINNTCLSFLKAMEMAGCLLHQGKFQRILIFASELPSYGMRKENHETFAMFGDGAMAMVLESASHGQHNSKILSSVFKTFPDGGSYNRYRAGGTLTHPKYNEGHDSSSFYFEMDGTKLYKIAYKEFPRLFKKLLAEAGIEKDDIVHVVPHQASYQGIKYIERALRFKENQFVNIVSDYGNQVSVSIPHAFYHLINSGKIKHGDKIMFLGAAAGVILGGMIIEY